MTWASAILEIEGVQVCVNDPSCDREAGDVWLPEGLASYARARDHIRITLATGLPCRRLVVTLAQADELLRDCLPTARYVKAHEIRILSLIDDAGGSLPVHEETIPLATCLDLRRRGMLEIGRDRDGWIHAALPGKCKPPPAKPHTGPPNGRVVIDIAEFRRRQR